MSSCPVCPEQNFAHLHVHEIEVADLADHRAAVHMDHPDFARRQLDLRIGLFLAAQRRHLTGGTNQLSTPSGLKLDAADVDADRNILQLQPVARLELRLRPIHHHIADLEADR